MCARVRIEITGTFKHQSTWPARVCMKGAQGGLKGGCTYTWHPTEVALRNEGMDPRKIRDQIFIFNAQTKVYEPFGPDKHAELLAGKARL
jgi:hypothetical protein